MTSGLIADSIVDFCGTIGLCVAMMTLYRRDHRSPLSRRLLLALGIIATLFLVRAVAWWTGSPFFDRLSSLPAALVPLGALVVTEGLLRRHAPRAVKMVVSLGSTVLFLGGVFTPRQFLASYTVALLLFQLAGFSICAWLLATRDRSALMASENRNIGRLAVGALLVIPFVLTDFRSLFPDLPVRLGALGALLTVVVMLTEGGGAETRRHGLSMMALRLISSALLGVGAAFLAPDVDAAQIMRFCAVAMAGQLTIGMMTDALRSLFESREPGILNSVAASPAQARDQLIAELAHHPIFESARRYREDDLTHYDPGLLRGLLSTRQVLRQPDAPWGLTSTDPAVERMVSLLTANSATHAIVLAHDPIDVIVLAVPVISADPATETAISLVRRLLALSPASK